MLLIPGSLSAQRNERKDSLVRLLGCDQLQQIEERGGNFRKALGHVRFEHNSTLLLCDTALWNVGANTIRGIGHVRIIQNRTVLSSDNLFYYIDGNLAEFRGAVVQLQDKDRNTLRTRFLDYNTKDSVATFMYGGSFRDKDGQIIESDRGTYDSKLKSFSFNSNVNMYTDSIFVKTDALDYNTGTGIAVFGTGTYAWRDDNMLSAKAGWYDHNREVFTFTKNVHIMTANQEAWSDTLVYYRFPNDAEMFGNVELLDTTRKVAAVAGYMQYIDSLQYIKMARDPAVIAVSSENETRDTVYVGADTLKYWTLPMCDVPQTEVKKAESRLKVLAVDPINEYRVKAAEKARSAAEEAKKKMAEDDPNAAASFNSGGGGSGGKKRNLPAPWDESEIPQLPDTLKSRTSQTEPLPQLDTTSRSDTLSVAAKSAATDSLDVPAQDSTRVGFLLGIRNVKVFRKDMQAVCDSLAYNDLDSLVRLYRNPVVWNEIRRQYSADSISVVVKNRALDRASLMSNAFIIVQEDSLCFDQIKGTEMMAYFDSTGVLKRFDSMGGSSGVFFLEEKGAFATVNKFEAKMLTASFKDGNIQDLNYFEEVKSDAYPVVQLHKDERLLKGFEWQPEKRPKGPEDITSYTPRKSERKKYESVPRAKFAQTDIYFPGYMKSVYKMLEEQNALKRERARERRRLEAEQEEEKAREAALKAEETFKEEETPQAGDGQDAPKSKDGQDASATGKDKDGRENQVQAPPAGNEQEKSDTSGVEAALPDSLAAGKGVEDLRSKIPDDPKAALKAQQKAEKEAKKAEKDLARQESLAKKEAKWAAKDEKDALKDALKAEKKATKQRAKMEKLRKAREEREAKEQKILERYKARYEKKKAREDDRALKKSEKKSEKKST